MPEEDYTGLSPEEIAAIKEDLGDEDPDEAPEKVEGEGANKDADNDDGSGQNNLADKDQPANSANETAPVKEGAEAEITKEIPKDGGDGKEGVGTDVAKAPEGEPGGDKTNVSTPAVSEQRPFVPQYQGASDEELTGLKTSLEEAKKKFDEGEIDFATFSESKDLYNEAKWKADFAKDANANLVDERWKWEQDRFLDDNKLFRDNLMLNSAFVSAVNTIIASEDGEKLGDRTVLLQAKEQVERDLSALTGGNGGTPGKDTKKADAIAAAKKAGSDRSNIPVDIASAPAATDNNDIAEFAYLDKLSGEKYQAAIDKMTPAQLEKYEEG